MKNQSSNIKSSIYWRGLSLLFCFLVTLSANAMIPEWWKEVHHYNEATDWHEYYTYTTSYFGPNAIPVPEILDGRIPKTHKEEVSTDFFWGFGDQTQSLSTRLTYTLIPGRFAVSGFGVLAEHYKTTMEVRDQRASMEKDGEETLLIGDFCISTLLRLFQEKKYCPDVVLEIALKTASSETPRSARYIDSPGYYFDFTTGKSLYFKHSYINELRLVGMIGFLSYQLQNSQQNDAPLFGGKMVLSSDKWSLENGIAGYSGWLGQGDCPLVLRSKLNMKSGSWTYFFQYQHALRDYPFRRIQVGVNFDF